VRQSASRSTALITLGLHRKESTSSRLLTQRESDATGAFRDGFDGSLVIEDNTGCPVLAGPAQDRLVGMDPSYGVIPDAGRVSFCPGELPCRLSAGDF